MLGMRVAAVSLVVVLLSCHFIFVTSPVSAAEYDKLDLKPDESYVKIGQSFSLQALWYHCKQPANSKDYLCPQVTNQPLTITATPSDGVGGLTTKSTDGNGMVYFPLTFSRAGVFSFQVSGASGKAVSNIAVVRVTEAASGQVELTGPATGTVGKSLAYTVKALACDAGGTCKPETVPITVSIKVDEPDGKYRAPEATTNTQGVATISIPFSAVGTYTLTAYGGQGRYQQAAPLSVSITEGTDQTTLKSTPSGTNGGGFPQSRYHISPTSTRAVHRLM